MNYFPLPPLQSFSLKGYYMYSFHIQGYKHNCNYQHTNVYFPSISLCSCVH